MNTLTLQKYRIFKAWIKTKPVVWGYENGRPIYDYQAFTRWWEEQTASFREQVVKGECEEPMVF
jgi:hypothetical protein